jgi:hypothetical protein
LKHDGSERRYAPVAVELVIDITTNVDDLSHAGQRLTLSETRFRSVTTTSSPEEVDTYRTDERIAVEELELSGSA